MERKVNLNMLKWFPLHLQAIIPQSKKFGARGMIGVSGVGCQEAHEEIGISRDEDIIQAIRR